jgi:hypothetical protein
MSGGTVTDWLRRDLDARRRAPSLVPLTNSPELLHFPVSR